MEIAEEWRGGVGLEYYDGVPPPSVPAMIKWKQQFLLCQLQRSYQQIKRLCPIVSEAGLLVVMVRYPEECTRSCNHSYNNGVSISPQRNKDKREVHAIFEKVTKR